MTVENDGLNGLITYRNADRLHMSGLSWGYRVEGGGGRVSASTLSGGEYLDFPVQGMTVENDGLNRFITVVTARTYPYQQNGHGFKGEIPRVTWLPVWWGSDAAARATDNETRPQRRTAARARRVVGIQGGGGGGCQHQRFLNSTASQPSIIYFNYPICDCSTLNTKCQGTCC